MTDRRLPETLSPQPARQGQLGRRITLILGVALILTAIGFAIVWSRYSGPLGAADANMGQQAVDSAAFDDDEGRIPAADAPTTSTGEPMSPPTGEAPNRNAPTVSAEPSGSSNRP